MKSTVGESHRAFSRSDWHSPFVPCGTHSANQRCVHPVALVYLYVVYGCIQNVSSSGLYSIFSL